jgi:hypothetical protein
VGADAMTITPAAGAPSSDIAVVFKIALQASGAPAKPSADK